MLDFPSGPNVGQEYTGAGTTFIWNGQGWVVKPAAGSGTPVDVYTKAESNMNFVDIAGDIMTGNLTISKPNATLTLAKPDASTTQVVGAKAAIARWGLVLGNNTAESGSNLGSDFGINRYSDTGTLLGAVLSIQRSTGAWYTTSPISLMRTGVDTLSITNDAVAKYMNFGIGVDGHARITVTDQTDLVLNKLTQELARFYSSGGLHISPTGASKPGIEVAASGSSDSIKSQATTGFAAMTGYDNEYTNYGMVGYAAINYHYSFYGNANAFLSGGTWGTSDQRFKQHTIEVTFDATKQVKAIPVKSFAWKPGQPMGRGDLAGETSFGWIAQDVERIVPNAVADIAVPPQDLELRAFLADRAPPAKDTPEAEKLSKRTDLTFKAINDHYMVAVLWKAVQELTARIEALEAKPV